MSISKVRTYTAKDIIEGFHDKRDRYFVTYEDHIAELVEQKWQAEDTARVVARSVSATLRKMLEKLVEGR